MISQQDVIWNNETGITLSNAGNVFIEATGSGRASMVPAGTRTAGTHITGTAGQASSYTVDNIRGWPFWRREHSFEVNVKSADRLFFEWRGEHTIDSTGFALGGGGIPANISRIYWFSVGRCHAVGSFVYQSNKSWLREPHSICYNTAQEGTNASVMSGHDAGTNAEAVQIAGGFQLCARPLGGHVGDNTADLRCLFPGISRSTVPFDNNFSQFSTSALSQGGLLWGFTERAASVDISRYPKSGDRLGWAYEVGYPDGNMVVGPGITNNAVATSIGQNVGPLRVSGLQKIWVTFVEVAPATGVTPFWLDFTNASMNIKGTITATRLYEKAWF